MKKFIYFIIFYLGFITCSFSATKYQITNLTDSNVSYTPGVSTGNLVSTKIICVYKKGGPGSSYKVTATSGNASGSTFRVYDNISKYVNYDIIWYDTINQSGSSFNLDSGIQSPTINNASGMANCSGGNSASFQIIFTQADLTAGTSGTYTDTLTIIIGPV